MTNEKEKTTPNVSVGADTEQSFQKCSNNSIPENDGKFNSFEMWRIWLYRALLSVRIASIGFV